MADGLDPVGVRGLHQALLSDPDVDPRDMQRRFDLPAPHAVSALGQLVDLKLIVPGDGSGDAPLAASQPAADPQDADLPARQDVKGVTWLSTASPRSSLLRLIEREETELEALVSRVRVIRTAMAAFAAEYDTLHVREAGRECAEVVLGREAIDTLLVEAGRSARREVLSMHHPLPVTGRLLEGRGAAAGVAARVLHLASTVRTPGGHLAMRSLRDRGTDVRLTAHTPLRVLVVDSSLAVLELVNQGAPPAALLLCGRESVEIVRELFEFCWLSARSLHAFAEQEEQEEDAASPSRRLGLPEPNELQRAALRMLAGGMKDEAIARQLGISVRTLGRLIGSLMADLNVSTRYQLGVRASALGWAH